MQRREMLQKMGGIGGTAAAIGLAGCGLLSCGPGETEIGTIADNPSDYQDEDDVEIRGEMSNITGDFPELDDTTGTASIVTLDSLPSDIENGDCVTFIGTPVTEGGSGGNETGGTNESEGFSGDIAFIPSEVEYEEG